MQAVMATPKPQPVFSPMYRLVSDKHAAQQRAHHDGPPGQLEHRIAAALVDLLEPLPLDLFRRALKTGNGQFEIIFARGIFRHDPPFARGHIDEQCPIMHASRSLASMGTSHSGPATVAMRPEGDNAIKIQIAVFAPTIICTAFATEAAVCSSSPAPR